MYARTLTQQPNPTERGKNVQFIFHLSDVKISIYIPACRIFLINFHRKNHQKSLIFIEKTSKSIDFHGKDMKNHI